MYSLLYAFRFIANPGLGGIWACQNNENRWFFLVFSIFRNLGSKMRQDLAKMRHERPKISQERRKLSQDRLQDGPREGQDRAKLGQDAAKMAQDGARSLADLQIRTLKNQ